MVLFRPTPRALAEALVRVAALGPAGENATDSRTLLSLVASPGVV